LVNLAIRRSFLTLTNGDGALVTFLAFDAISGLSAGPCSSAGEGRLEGV
jgi:hypothetical protein